ncbi:MAG: hypothetical protein WKG00_35720 [Polyangiaceae bacterium]
MVPIAAEVEEVDGGHRVLLRRVDGRAVAGHDALTLLLAHAGDDGLLVGQAVDQVAAGDGDHQQAVVEGHHRVDAGQGYGAGRQALAQAPVVDDGQVDAQLLAPRLGHPGAELARLVLEAGGGEADVAAERHLQGARPVVDGRGQRAVRRRAGLGVGRLHHVDDAGVHQRRACARGPL